MSGGFVGSLVRKLTSADASGVMRLFEDMGRDALLSAVGGASTPLGIGLNAFLQFTNATDKQFRREQKKKDRPLTAAQKRRQYQQHQEWLKDNRWRFDWRSQPRRPAGTDAGGEWVDGRLDYPVEMKKPFSRSVIQRRTRSMREYKARRKAMGDTKTRTIRSAWGDY